MTKWDFAWFAFPVLFLCISLLAFIAYFIESFWLGVLVVYILIKTIFLLVDVIIQYREFKRTGK